MAGAEMAIVQNVHRMFWLKDFFLHSYLSFYFKSLYATIILENALGFKKNVGYKLE